MIQWWKAFFVDVSLPCVGQKEEFFLPIINLVAVFDHSSSTILFPGCIRSFNLLICAMIIFQERLFFATQMTRTSLPNFNFLGHQVSPSVPSHKLSLTNERCVRLCESKFTKRNALHLYQDLEGVSSQICFLNEQKN